MDTFVLAGGCFWCVDAVFRRLYGVESVVSGYTGGTVKNPTYEQVTTGSTGHAEAIAITFDTFDLKEEKLLDLFFLIHNPTTLNRQGNDIGTQYRSAMFYTHEQQKKTFEEARERAKEHWGNAIVTTIQPLETFYPAEDYHQDYFNKNPGNGYCSVVIEPKIAKARAAYKELFIKKEQV